MVDVEAPESLPMSIVAPGVPFVPFCLEIKQPAARSIERFAADVLTNADARRIPNVGCPPLMMLSWPLQFLKSVGVIRRPDESGPIESVPPPLMVLGLNVSLVRTAIVPPPVPRVRSLLNVVPVVERRSSVEPLAS